MLVIVIVRSCVYWKVLTLGLGFTSSYTYGFYLRCNSNLNVSNSTDTNEFIFNIFIILKIASCKLNVLLKQNISD